MNVSKQFCFGLLMAGALVGAPAYASSSFNGAAFLSFDVTGDLAGVLISTGGSFYDDATVLVGDATVVPGYTFASPSLANFSVASHVNDSLGSLVYTGHIANFLLTFDNSSSEARTFNLDFGYTLTGLISGEFADGLVQIQYGDFGFDELQVNQFGSDNVTWSSSTGPIEFTLASGASASYNVTTFISSNLAGTTPVPIAGIFWPFMAVLLGWLKRYAR